MEGKKQFLAVLIKPSHYDNEGYVIQWARSIVPSNTLAALYGLSKDVAERHVLGDEIEIKLSAYDETNTRIPIHKIIKEIKAAEAGGFVGFTGVQSNQFPHAMDMARLFRNANIQVCIGGFHVSGCLAMLPEIPDDIQQALDIGISIYAGECEGRLDEVFKDARAGKMKPIYNYISDLPTINAAPPPFLPAEMLKRSINSSTSVDAGRGCPFICSFCTIINVQGRKSRRRSADDIEKTVRINAAQGINQFLFTDDNFARNKDWEPIFDRLILMREQENMDIRLTLQVDTMCHRIKGFIEKAGRAGTTQVFIGLEAINPDNLKAAKKGQNNIREYRKLMQAWRKAGVITVAGYILGFPTDSRERIINDIKTIQKELPIDLLEFFYLTPLPGSMDHKVLYEKGAWIEPDLNQYDLSHVTAKHENMSKEEWQDVYQLAWDTYYTEEHIETIMRRAYIDQTGISKVAFMAWWFHYCFKHEDIHPLEGGFYRKKHRRDRRPGLPIENPFIFYPKRLTEIIRNHGRMISLHFKYDRIKKKIFADPDRAGYIDTAITPVSEDEAEKLDMLSN
jgi:radical SAM superfamily enzyme YgiQ (UPF0313 family)